MTAAAQGDARAVYLVNNSPVSRTVRLSLKGADGAAFEIARLDDAHDSEKTEPFDPSADLTLAPHQIVLLTTAAEAKAVDRGAERKVFAGQDAGH